MAINRRGGLYRGEAGVGEGISSVAAAVSDAEAAATAAALSEAAAAASEAAAALSEAAAAASAVSAEDWDNLAQEWAENAEDAAVTGYPGQYSALHHSAKASAQRVLAETARTGAETAETNAETAQTAAELAETNAETAQTASEAARDLAQTYAGDALSYLTSTSDLYDLFDDRFLGSKASDPTLDNDGDALVEGALYWNSTAKELRAYNGSAWVAAVVPTSDYVAVAGDTMTGNLTVPMVVTDSAMSHRNKIINGNFDFWQRGTSGSSGFVADRWETFQVGSTVAISAQSFTVGQTDVPSEPKYFHRTVVTSSAGASNYVLTTQAIESVRTFAGQTITVSFWAKADAAKNVALEFVQAFGTGGSPSASVTGIGSQLIALTTSWQQFSVTIAVPSISGKTLGTAGDDYLGMIFWWDAGSTFNARTASLGQQSGTFDISQIQVEAGSVATPFEHRPIGVEQALCQRYYQKFSFNSPVWCYTANAWMAYVVLPTTLRAAPSTYSLVATSGSFPSGLDTTWTNNDANATALRWVLTPITATAGDNGYLGNATVIADAEL